MMLLRAAVRPATGMRAAALTSSPALRARSIPAAWSRGMAKDNKPQHHRFTKPQNAAQKPSHPPPNSSAATPTSKAGKESPAQPTAESSTESAAPPKSQQEQQQPQEPTPDLSKLPDLTQGIPSTLEYERAGATNRSSLAAVEEEEATSSGGGRAKGELPASAYVSSSERRRQKLAIWAFALTGVFTVGGIAYLGRDWDEEELSKNPDVPNGWSITLWWKRAMARLGDTVTYYQEPAFEKLLPDPDPSFERPYTLCISLEDMLVHSEWSREHGWRVAKRPGVDYFLHYLSQYYEIVLFTTVPFATGEPLVRKLDPYRFIMWPLFREATKYKDGEIVKDLSYLNRDLSKVIIIDTNAKHVRAQPENAIVLPKWTGDPKDKELVSLVPFLEFIHTMQYTDVRKVIKSFEGHHIPTEFARREALARAEHNKRIQAKSSRGGGMSWLSSHLGLKPSNMSLMVAPEGEENPQEAFAKGKMLQDIARERGMRNYLMLEEEIRKNGEKWLKEEQEAMEKAQKEAMKSMKSSFFGWFRPAEENTEGTASNPETKHSS
ncbi:Mitochondrial import inner membrane translocase subunit tim50 [Madurella mycetomatis]|uniref:Mitochondrial import inner membrane translocase subunit TIM50 n=1 Tax=Madurella mycetomatis TaxID=100816 RepID=A0A175WH51_9PEZI|nr:Mitochondrial import inner membrane translocase subunit tim50 [Madurella mycetomatis]KXX82895.1 Mitochondrial import inner membrane translocase subunit tim50 [Madurella mycetomatis]